MKPFSRAISRALLSLRDHSTIVHPDRWQSIDVSKLPEAATHEILNHTLTSMVWTEDLIELARDIQPNLPWADDHFQERVGGKPLNPGLEWAHWPWANKADTFRTEPMPDNSDNHRGPVVKMPAGDEWPVQTGFSHTYMERMWPKKANLDSQTAKAMGPYGARVGVRYKYGDAMDVVEHLAKHPLSRQAYLPIWFPEDTGKSDVRVPCTLGYHFIMRGGFLHCTYYIRSCDAYRHMRDDIYLTVRLLLWVLNELRQYGHPNIDAGKEWDMVKPGIFTMHIVSLHVFRNDYIKMFGGG